MNFNQQFLNKRVPPGFRLGEGLAYLLFCSIWPLTLGTIYYLGNAFNMPNFVSLQTFIYLNITTVGLKTILMLPVWWLFFKKLKDRSFAFKIGVHAFSVILFSATVVSVSHLCYHFILSARYPKDVILSDLYTHTVYYFFHVSLFHGYNFYLDQQKQKLRSQQLQALAYESEIRALRSQIEPHFLFNTLNSISASIPPSMEQTRVMIAQLADTFRHALQTSNCKMISLEAELAFIQTLLALEQKRFDKRLQIEYHIDKACLNAELPPMLLQPLIENALNHGIGPKVEGGIVRIDCNKAGAYVHIAVSDTGVGYNGALPNLLQQGVGLSNIARRLQLLYNENLEVQHNDPGLRFYFKIPFQPAHAEKSNLN